MKKSLVGVLLAVVMCVMVFTGCDDKTGAQGNAVAEQGETIDGYEGKWVIYAMEEDGLKKDFESYYQDFTKMMQGVMDEKEIEESLQSYVGIMETMTMVLKADGKVVMTTTIDKKEEKVEGTWKETEKGVSVTIEGDTQELKYENDDLTIEEEVGYKVYFTKEEMADEKVKITKEEYAKKKAEEEAKPPITEGMDLSEPKGPIKSYVGKWFIYAMDEDGKKRDLNALRKEAIKTMVKDGGSEAYAENAIDSVIEILVQYTLELKEDGTGTLSMAGMTEGEPDKEKITWKETKKGILVTTEDEAEMKFTKKGGSLYQKDETLGGLYFKKSQ